MTPIHLIFGERCVTICAATTVVSALVALGCGGTSRMSAPRTGSAVTNSDPGTRATAPHEVFTVQQLTSITTDDKQASCYAIKFSYAVPDRAHDAYMPGIGTIPPRGNLDFISCEPELSITDGAGGAVLAHLAFSNPTQFMGDDVIPLPKPNEFTSACQTADWQRTGAPTFGPFAIGVLQDEFQLLSVLREGQESRIVTTYKTLNPQKTIRIAVMVGYPDGATPISFKICVKAQERREHTDWREPTESSTLDAALAALTSIRHKLETGK